ncbi:hypothetical protein CRG98_024597 [Punica granatum]|uniref:GST N-terminal domain-containing protein n=1 Tax=Punica granatum TaxID=22663 RepID=A0A2I0JFH3_PUNGR|nr:hypothetical protein CRG98_024597 [Punica granatum]
MASISVASSVSLPRLSHPPLRPEFDWSSLPRPSNFSPFSGNGRPRLGNPRRFRAKSAGPDQQLPKRRSESADGPSPSTSFLSVLCPLLRLFSGGDPSRDRNEALEVATSSLSTLARLPWGSRSVLASEQNQEATISGPLMHLQIFEFEACPFCRRVREAMTELDLSVEIYPCPKGSARHRAMVRELGGKEQFPFMIDPNAGISMYESGDIVKYLFEKYGKGRSPSSGLLERYCNLWGATS